MYKIYINQHGFIRQYILKWKVESITKRKIFLFLNHIYRFLVLAPVGADVD